MDSDSEWNRQTTGKVGNADDRKDRKDTKGTEITEAMKLEDPTMKASHVIGGASASFHRRVRCCICGFSEVRTDEVLDRGVLFLAECPRCDHRWTSLEPIAAPSTAAPPVATTRVQRVAARFSREVQPAA
jgi:hypothetical protein